jgi:copper chaperone NosL
MNKRRRFHVAGRRCCSLTPASQEPAQDIAPQEMTAETLGHYCQMNLLEHPGPKAQVHLKGMARRCSSARCATRSPMRARRSRSRRSSPIYVNDMGAPGATWETPGDGNWIDADKAFFVVGSNQNGGMGAPETVPFATQAKAEEFARKEGGRVLQLPQIADEVVLAPVEQGPAQQSDEDYENRIRALPEPSVGG